jgi:serine/threonine protein kinase
LKKNEVDFYEKKPISEATKKLIKKMILYDPKERISFEELFTIFNITE